MKRTLLVFLLVNLILSACAPVSAPTPTPAPSATPLPTTTATPTSTPTATPTATPTPIPTIQVGNLSLPDPRVTNPELFDLRNPNAPIPQFVNALRMAGIEITAEQVAQGITYEALKDKEGNPFVVAVYNLNPSLLPQEYRALAGPIPLMIAEKGEKGWGWNEPINRYYADANNISFGTLVKGALLNNPKYTKVFGNQFNTALIAWATDWMILEKTKGVLDFSYADRYINFAQRNKMQIVAQALIYGGAIPDWLKNGKFTTQEYLEMMQTHIKTVMDRYRGKIPVWVVVNEAHWDATYDFWKSKVGDNYIEIAFQTAREADPSAQLIYSDFFNETPSLPKTKFNQQIVTSLKSKGLIDGIGLHMRINAAKPPKKEDLVTTMRSYGVPVYITELDVDLSDVHGTNQERYLLQASIYKTIMEAALESGVCKSFIVFGIGDQYSWLETDLKKPNADATMYDDNLDPKPAFYAVSSALLEHLREKIRFVSP